MITENTAVINSQLAKVISKDVSVFYNPIMKHNRDTCVAVIQAMCQRASEKKQKEFSLGLALEASGIRGIRLAHEAFVQYPQIHATILMNDRDERAVNAMKQNIAQNHCSKISNVAFDLTTKSAELALLEHASFDYVDIDPYGSPNPFLDSAVKRVKHKGVLAVTATDLAALCGSQPLAARRKYDAVVVRHACRHEWGLRLLIRKVQLVAAQLEIGAVPLLCYFKDHYYRCYFIMMHSRRVVDQLLAQHKLIAVNDANGVYVENCIDLADLSQLKARHTFGPLYVGPLQSVATNLAPLQTILSQDSFFHNYFAENEQNVIGFYKSDFVAQEEKFCQVNTLATCIKQLNDAGFLATRTHFDTQGIKTNAPKNVFLKILQLRSK